LWKISKKVTSSQDDSNGRFFHTFWWSGCRRLMDARGAQTCRRTARLRHPRPFVWCIRARALTIEELFNAGVVGARHRLAPTGETPPGFRVTRGDGRADEQVAQTRCRCESAAFGDK
jgi:hypothetical protein